MGLHGTETEGVTEMAAYTIYDTDIFNHLDEIGAFFKRSDSAEDIAAVGIRLAEIIEQGREAYKALRAKPVAPVAAPVIEDAPKGIADATYTVSVSDTEWYTVKIDTKESGSLAGKRIASFLAGPDNESDFVGFAFVNEDGTVAVWKRFRSEGYAPYVEALNTVMGYPTLADEFRTAYAMKSGKCARCGRKLTVPASLNRGLGPDCAGMI